MNNRVQQRFDRSIRQAVDETKQVRERKSELIRSALQAAARERARILLPVVERALDTGMIKGRKLTAQESRSMQDLRNEYRRLLEEREK